MNRITLLFAAVFLLCGCATNPAPTVTSVNVSGIQTSAVLTVWAPVTLTAQAKPTITLTNTAIPPTATPAVPSGEFYAWNYPAEQDSGGIKIQVARVLIAQQAALLPDTDFSKDLFFDGKPVAVEIAFIVTNTTNKEATVYPDQGTIVIGNEQIPLLDAALAREEWGDDFSGKIYPGAKLIGGIWFGLKRTPLANIQNMLIAINAPYDDTTFTRLGPDFRINVDLSQRRNDPMPDELK